MKKEKWQEVYRRAAVEVDGQKIPGRVAAARQAIGERLEVLEGDLDCTEERQQIGDALRGLATLELEVRSWQHRRLTLDPEQ